MSIDPAVIEAIKIDHPVYDIASKHVLLRPRGGRFVGPCPICGGDKSNSRFEIIDEVSWVCAVCSDGGDVIRLVEKIEQINFVEAVDRLRRIDPISDDAARRIQQKAIDRRLKSEAAAEKKRVNETRRALEIWESGAPLDASRKSETRDYLALRRLGEWQGARLRNLKCAPYFTQGHDGRFHKIYEGPAMLALVTARIAGEIKPIGCHMTWIDLAKPKGKAQIVDPESGEILPAKKMRGAKRGGFIFLGRTGTAHRVVIGEGIETVLAARAGVHPKFEAMWLSAIDLGNLGGASKGSVSRNDGTGRTVPSDEPDESGPSIEMPPHVSEIIILGDGDSDPLLTQNTIRRASRRWQKEGRSIRVAWAAAGRDFNDMLEG